MTETAALVNCDGCRQPADANHLRERVERLEMSTRYRPIHVHTLVVSACPSQAFADYFYNVAPDRKQRSDSGHARFTELAQSAPDAIAKPGGASGNDEAVLIEWQRRGLFLAHPVDCFMAPGPALDAQISASAKTLILRLNTSYRPKHVALIGRNTASLIAPLEASGWQGKLILDNGSPFDGTGFGTQLAAAIHTAA
jgi:hypothetical protein